MNKRKRNVLLSISALMIIMVVGVYFIVNSNKEVSEFEDGVNKITEMSLEDQKAALDKIVEDGMMNVQYTTHAIFDEKVSTTFNIKNIENNHYPITFDIVLEDGTVVYESNKIGLGYELSKIELTEALSSGIYNAKIKIGYASEGNISSVFPITLEVL